MAQFAQVSDFYSGKKIPDDEFFANTVVRNFNVSRERVNTFVAVFIANLNYLRAFSVPETAANPEGPVATTAVVSGGEPSEPASEHAVREYLDTCFVIMPFGEWFDVYYEKVYKPAIKESGFEPLRADELFSTGSVIEQIWEQIQKSKVLLADLTGECQEFCV